MDIKGSILRHPEYINLPRNEANFHLSTGLLLPNQVREVVETFFDEMRNRAETEPELAAYKDKIYSCDYELNIVKENDLAKYKEFKLAYLWVSEPVVYHLILGRDPATKKPPVTIMAGGPMTRPDIQEYRQNYINQLIDNDGFDYESAESRMNELYEDDIDYVMTDNEAYQKALSTYEENLRKGGVLVEAEPFTPPLVEVTVAVTEKQAAEYILLKKAEAIKMGLDPKMVEFDGYEGLTYVQPAFAKPPKPNKQGIEVEYRILESSFIEALWVTEEIIREQFAKFNTDHILYKNQKTKKSFTYPVVSTIMTSKKDGTRGRKFVIEFSDLPDASSDAIFAMQMRTEFDLVNADNSDEKIHVFMSHKPITSTTRLAANREGVNELKHQNELVKEDLERNNGIYRSRGNPDMDRTWKRTTYAAPAQPVRREPVRREPVPVAPPAPPVVNAWKRGMLPPSVAPNVAMRNVPRPLSPPKSIRVLPPTRDRAPSPPRRVSPPRVEDDGFTAARPKGRKQKGGVTSTPIGNLPTPTPPPKVRGGQYSTLTEY